jgi:DNA-binding PadR family transcriptional regulator
MHGHHRGGGPHGRRGHSHFGDFRPEERMGRLLGQGDLRFVILSLLAEKPRHGYELIKALEDLSSGAYSPSPGTIYPTLTYLDEAGYATSTPDQNKKLYTITKEGSQIVNENKEAVAELLSRFSRAGEKMSRFKHMMGRDETADIARSDRSPIRKAMHALKTELFSFTDGTKSKQQVVADIITKAAEEIRKLKS